MSLSELQKKLGLDELHVAVLQGKLNKAKELVRAGWDINTRSAKHQMTPLHLAVILKKFSIVCFLIRRGADLNAQDGRKRTPRNYIKKRLGGTYLAAFKQNGYRHDESVLMESRKLGTLFRYQVAMRSLLGRRKHPLSKSVMYLDGKNVIITREITRVSLPELAKNSTYGFITGPSLGFPDSVFAISGWKYTEPPAKKVLANGKFTQLVRDAAKSLDFRLPPQREDAPGCSKAAPEDVGRYLASHVEKQLGIYWVLCLLEKYKTTNELSRLSELGQVSLRENEINPRIFIDHSPCDNCLGFLGALEKAVGNLKFVVEPIPFAHKGERNARGCPNCSCDTCTKKSSPPKVSAATYSPVKIDDEDDEDEVTRAELRPFKIAKQVVLRGKNAPTRPPVTWIEWRGSPSKPSVAKPETHEVTKEEYCRSTLSLMPDSSQPSASQASGVIPLSTIGNRSAFFASPSVEPVSSTHPHWNPPPQAEQAPVEAESIFPEVEGLDIQIYEPSRGWHPPTSTSKQKTSNVTIEKSRKRLNLGRFRLASSITSPPRSYQSPRGPAQRRQPPVTTVSSPPTLTPRKKRGRPKGSKNKKPSRARIRQENAIRERSTFAQAWRSHQQRSRIESRTRTPKKTPKSTRNTPTQLSEKVCRDTREYFERHMKDGTLPNDIEPQLCLHGLEMPHYL